MKKLCNYLAAACLLVCGCIFAFEAQARVCFATDENCGSGGNFANMDDTALLDDSCTSEGYTETSCEPTKIEYKCPYKAGWKKCCNLDYNYSTCVYPMLSAGQCGGKSKCTCDQTKYKWTEKRCAANSKNSMTGGASCAQQVLNEAGNGLDFETYYTECRCDRGAYPKTKDMCDAKATFGDSCIAVDANGVESEYFADCYCDTQIYTESAATCYPFVGAEESGHCTSGGVTYYKSCKTCSEWPAKNLDHVAKDAYSEPLPEDYERCPYAQTTGYYKIKRCREPGYEVNSDGSACEPISCTKAAQMYVAHNDRYLLLTTGGTYTYTETINEKTGVASYTPKYTYDTSKTVIVAEDINIGYLPYNTQYQSGQYTANQNKYSQYGKILNIACTKAPTVTYGNSCFPVSESTTYSYGINYKLNNSITVKSPVYIKNGNFNLNGYTLNITRGRLDLDKDVFNPNVDDLYIGHPTDRKGTIKITGEGILWMKRYNMKLDYLYLDQSTIKDEGRDKYNIVKFWIEGSQNDLATIEATRMALKGLGGIKYANTYINASCIGCDFEWRKGWWHSLKDSQHHFSMLYLFDTNWFMYEKLNVFTVYIAPGCFLGNGWNGDEPEKGLSSSTGTAKIIYIDNTQYAYINSRVQYDNCKNGSSCESHTFNDGWVVTDYGGTKKITGRYCSIWCDSASDGGDYGNSAICAVNGNKNIWFDSGKKNCFMETVFASVSK